MSRVVRALHADLYPRAECLGEGTVEEPGTCGRTWIAHPNWLQYTRGHIQFNPTHRVLVVRESRSVYEIEGRS